MSPASSSESSVSPDTATDLAGLLRVEPYRIFFPLGLVLGVAGVIPWLLLSMSVIGADLGFFHGVTQMQGSALAFIAGFLLTAIPKRTRSSPANVLEIGALCLLLPTISVATFFELPAGGQVAYALALAVLAQFALRRFVARSSGGRPPASFVVVLLGLIAGVSGAVLHAIAIHADMWNWMRQLGRGLAFQGVFLCVTLGIGAFLSPPALRAEAESDLGSGARPARAVVGYLLCGLLVLGGLGLDAAGHFRVGSFIRGLAAMALLIGSGAWRLSGRSGANRLLSWVSAWCVPAGMLATAALPEYGMEALHITFIGGFGLLAFASAGLAALDLRSFEKRRPAWPIAIVACGLLFGLAILARSWGNTMEAQSLSWLGAAAVLWLAGTIVWGAILILKPSAASLSRAP